VRAGFGHSVPALRHDTVLHEFGHDRRRRGGARDPEVAHGACMPRGAGSDLGEQVDRMGRHTEQELGAGVLQPIKQALAAGQIVNDKFATPGQRGDQRTEPEIVAERA
jgi:hypothetical protein